MWKGKVQKLVNNKGIPKGLIQVLKERGKYREKMKLAETREEIATHQDFQDEKTRLQHFLHQHGHTCILLPKFHCELREMLGAGKAVYKSSHQLHSSSVASN